MLYLMTSGNQHILVRTTTPEHAQYLAARVEAERWEDDDPYEYMPGWIATELNPEGVRGVISTWWSTERLQVVNP